MREPGDAGGSAARWGKPLLLTWEVSDAQASKKDADGLALVVVGVVAGAAGWAAHAPSGQGGIRKAEALSADELATLLGVKVWKMTLTLPADAKRVTAGLCAQEKGKPARMLGSMLEVAVDPSAPLPVLVGIIPLDGQIDDATRIRVIVSIHGGSIYSTVDNPLKGLGTVGFPSPPQQADGSYLLLGSYRNSVMSVQNPPDRSIGLQIEATPAGK